MSPSSGSIAVPLNSMVAPEPKVAPSRGVVIVTVRGGLDTVTLMKSLPGLPDESDVIIARGAYLVRTLGHCGECHTPRSSLGIPDLRREFSGAPLGDGEVEAIDSEALVQWTEEDLGYFLFLGVKPDGEFVGGEMEKVIEHNTSKLNLEDRQAIAAFLKRS